MAGEGGTPATPMADDKGPVTHHDHYQTLGIAPSATAEEIRLAYRRLAMRWHPDRNPGNANAAEERFKRVQIAFAVLKDPAARAAYDNERTAPRASAAGGARPSPSRARETWAQAAAAAAQRAAAQRATTATGKAGVDYVCETSIPLETAVLGGTATTRVRMEADCLRCDAKGVRMVPCGGCGGTGHVKRGLFNAQATCERCAGRGQEPTPCDQCAGTGKIRIDKSLRVQIKPGVVDGTVLRARGMGGPGLDGGPNGNLLCRVHVRKDRVFGVEGLDLTRELRIDFVLAILGGTVPVLRFREHIPVEVPSMTRSGAVLRVAGMGLHDRARERTGDLLLTVVVDLPTRMRPLSDEQLALLREMGGGGLV